MSECTLAFVRKDLRQAWKEYEAGDPAALGTTILAMERLVNYIQSAGETPTK